MVGTNLSIIGKTLHNMKNRRKNRRKKLKNIRPTSLRLAQNRRQKTISRAQVNSRTMSILILSVFFRLDSVRNAKKVHAQLNEFGEATIQLDGQDYVLEVQKGRYLNLKNRNFSLRQANSFVF